MTLFSHLTAPNLSIRHQYGVELQGNADTDCCTLHAQIAQRIEQQTLNPNKNPKQIAQRIEQQADKIQTLTTPQKTHRC
jgi:hypothetical protein